MIKEKDHFFSLIKGEDEQLGSLVENIGYSYLDSLVSIGFLPPDDTKNLQEPPERLPQDRKGLIACYVIYSGIIDENRAINGGFSAYIKNYILKQDAFGKVVGDRSIADVLGADEITSVYKEWQDDLIRVITEKVTSFVLEKRRRIRVELKKAILLRIAELLSMEVSNDEETGEFLDSIPELRAMAEENGYRVNAESLNEEDRKALSFCADFYLDLLEVLYLNGIGERRIEEYKDLYDEEERLKEDFYFRDIEDEALMNFGDIYEYQSILYSSALKPSLCYKSKFDLIGIAKLINSPYCFPKGLKDRFFNSKFKEYALALYTDSQIKESVSPYILARWDKYLQKQEDKGSIYEAPVNKNKKAFIKKTNKKK